MAKYEQGDEVTVTLSDSMAKEGWVRTGRIIGIATGGDPAIGHMWIVEDTSGELPNAEYPYSSYSVPESMIRKV